MPNSSDIMTPNLDWIEWIAYQNKEINEFVGILNEEKDF